VRNVSRLPNDPSARRLTPTTAPARPCDGHENWCATEGLPIAQPSLAQLYAARRAGPKDLVHAYTWFLIAGEQITQAKNHVNQSMTMEQLLEAEQRAAEWIRR